MKKILLIVSTFFILTILIYNFVIKKDKGDDTYQEFTNYLIDKGYTISSSGGIAEKNFTVDNVEISYEDAVEMNYNLFTILSNPEDSDIGITLVYIPNQESLIKQYNLTINIEKPDEIIFSTYEYEVSCDIENYDITSNLDKECQEYINTYVNDYHLENALILLEQEYKKIADFKT